MISNWLKEQKKAYIEYYKEYSYPLSEVEEDIKDVDTTIIVGDTHFNNLTPSSRRDDYAETTLEKLDTLLKKCVENKANRVIFLGDLFHKPKQPLDYLNALVDKFTKFKDENITLYTISGNSHDIFNDRQDSLPRTSLGLLFATGVIKPLGYISLNSVKNTTTFWGYHYPDKPILIPKNDTYDKNIAICHLFFEENMDEDEIKTDEAIKLNYNYYCLGHSHTQFENVTLDNGAVILRPGSLTRGTAHQYQLSKKVAVDAIKIYKDGQIEVNRNFLKVKPAEEVFTTNAINPIKKTIAINVDSNPQMEHLMQQLNSIERKESGTDIFNILDKVKLDNSVRNRIELYLTEAGILRSGETSNVSC